ncbi:MAG: 30S ribosomal protein S4 [Patescibacteria group bacterium]|jgi:small subunit ribosomal protein S4
MGRYTGPRTKISRRFGEPLFGNDKAFSRRNYPPGQHGQKRQRRQSEYGMQLREKQKTRYIYGILERQFRSYYGKALVQEGETGTNLLRLLEQRLDNGVYRAGWAKTRAHARQMVNHGQVKVNGRKVDVPSYTLRPGDTITLKEKVQQRPEFVDRAKALEEQKTPSWIQLKDGYTAEVTAVPQQDDLPREIEAQRIVEFYSR